MKVVTASAYVQVRLWLGLLEKSDFYSPARYVKSLMKSLRLHIIVVEPSQTKVHV